MCTLRFLGYLSCNWFSINRATNICLFLPSTNSFIYLVFSCKQVWVACIMELLFVKILNTWPGLPYTMIIWYFDIIPHLFNVSDIVIVLYHHYYHSGSQLHFPLHLPWGQVQRLCTALWVSPHHRNYQHCQYPHHQHDPDPGIRSPWSFRGLTNAYSPVYWCSTKVDINGFHIRGPFTQPGVGCLHKDKCYHYLYSHNMHVI